MSTEPEWLAPESLEEALALKAERRESATVVAGGTFVGILVSQRLLAPEAFLSLQRVPGLDYARANGDLRLGALTTHRTVELSPLVRAGWPALAHAVPGNIVPDFPVINKSFNLSYSGNDR